MYKSLKITITNIVFLHTDQERAEEDERDKVEVGKVASAITSHSSWEFIAGAVAEAGQHDLVPRLACGTPEDQPHLSTSERCYRYSRNIPEEKGQGLKKGLEVVVMIYCVVLNQFDVSKHLRKQESRWFTSNHNVHGQSLRGYSEIKKSLHLGPQELK